MKPMKQKQMVEGVFYLLQEIYGIENKNNPDAPKVGSDRLHYKMDQVWYLPTLNQFPDFFYLKKIISDIIIIIIVYLVLSKETKSWSNI